MGISGSSFGRTGTLGTTGDAGFGGSGSWCSAGSGAGDSNVMLTSNSPRFSGLPGSLSSSEPVHTLKASRGRSSRRSFSVSPIGSMSFTSRSFTPKNNGTPGSNGNGGIVLSNTELRPPFFTTSVRSAWLP